jgi:hypothetical protein
VPQPAAGSGHMRKLPCKVLQLPKLKIVSSYLVELFVGITVINAKVFKKIVLYKNRKSLLAGCPAADSSL